jgi:hypothetical protein
MPERVKEESRRADERSVEKVEMLENVQMPEDGNNNIRCVAGSSRQSKQSRIALNHTEPIVTSSYPYLELRGDPGLEPSQSYNSARVFDLEVKMEEQQASVEGSGNLVVIDPVLEDQPPCVWRVVPIQNTPCAEDWRIVDTGVEDCPRQNCLYQGEEWEVRVVASLIEYQSEAVVQQKVKWEGQENSSRNWSHCPR